MTDTQTGEVVDPAAGDAMDQLDQLGDDQQVPVSVVRAIRGELKELKEASRMEKERAQSELTQKDDQLMLYRMQLNQLSTNAPAASAPAPNAPPDPLADLDPDEPVTAGTLRTLVGMFTQRMDQTQAASASERKMMLLVNQPDFKDLTEKHFPNVLKNDPSLAQEFRAIPDEATRWAFAYRIGKLDPAYQKNKLVEDVHPDAAKIKENLSKPGSLARVSSPTIATTSQADRIKAMSSSEFKAYRAKKRAGQG